MIPPDVATRAVVAIPMNSPVSTTPIVPDRSRFQRGRIGDGAEVTVQNEIAAIGVKGGAIRGLSEDGSAAEFRLAAAPWFPSRK